MFVGIKQFHRAVTRWTMHRKGSCEYFGSRPPFTIYPIVGSFPDGHSALMLVTARLRHIAGTKWGIRRYLDMKHLYEREKEQAEAELEAEPILA